jgi:hypothetical protein
LPERFRENGALANDRSRETSRTEGGVLHLNIECGEIEKDTPQAYAAAAQRIRPPQGYEGALLSDVTP